MKKTIFTVCLSLILGLAVNANAQNQQEQKTVSSPNSKLKEAQSLSFRPSGVFIGPNYVSNSSTELLAYAWGGDPIPAGAFIYIDTYDEYQSAGFPGSEGNTIYVPVSAFGGVGNHVIGVVFWEDGILYNYALPIAVTVY